MSTILIDLQLCSHYKVNVTKEIFDGTARLGCVAEQGGAIYILRKFKFKEIPLDRAYFITAIGTPLTENEQLHEQGLEIQLQDQWSHGIDGILVAGSMGAMQLLTDETYQRLIERSVELSAGRGEILVGAGDTGLTRTIDRIKFINQFKIDGVAVLAPFFWNFSQEELVDYYSVLADVSKAPLYLYDLPAVTGTKLSMETMTTLAKHPNIKGAKVSCDTTFSVPLIESLGHSFRIIVAKPDLMDILIHHGIYEHLDGLWAIAPKWTIEIGRCAAKGDWLKAAGHRRDLITLRSLLPKYGFAAFTNMMNVRGIPGDYVPRPFARLKGDREQEFLSEPIIKKLIEEDPAQS